MPPLKGTSWKICLPRSFDPGQLTRGTAGSTAPATFRKGGGCGMRCLRFHPFLPHHACKKSFSMFSTCYLLVDLIRLWS